MDWLRALTLDSPLLGQNPHAQELKCLHVLKPAFIIDGNKLLVLTGGELVP